MSDGMERPENEKRDYREKFLDYLEEEYKVPVFWKDGPVQNIKRRVTDKCCLVIFILYLLLMIVTMSIAVSNSEHEDITKLYDSSGNACGFDEAEGFEILLLQRFSKPFISVCVKECPSFDYNEIKYKTKGGVDKAENYPGKLSYKGFNSDIAGLSSTKDPNLDFKEAFDFDDKWVNNYYTEEQWNNYQKDFVLECYPNNEVQSCKFKKDVLHFYDSYPVLNSFCVPLAPKPALLFNKVSNKFDHGVIGDMTDGVSAFGWCALVALGISLVFLLLIVCCTSIMTWILFIGLAVSLIVFGAFIIYNIYSIGPLNSGVNAARVKYLYFLISNKTFMLCFGIIMIILGIICIVLIIKNRQKINNSVLILALASKHSLKNILLIILSVFIIGIQIGVFFVELYVILRLYTSGEEVHDGDSGSPFVKYENTDSTNFFMFVHFFGMYWLIVVLNNLNDYVCAAVTVNYYFNTDIKNIRIFCHVLGHNIGSIAMSIFLLPIMLISMVLGVFTLCISKNNKFFCCCCWFYQRLVEPYNESYFPVSYMGSENFCTANYRFYYLSQRYEKETKDIILMGNVFGIVGKLVISLFTGYFGYTYYQNSIELQQNIDYISVYMSLCFLIGFFIGSLFINLYSTFYDSIMVCYLIEKNLGTEVVRRDGDGDDGAQDVKDAIQEINKYYAQLTDQNEP